MALGISIVIASIIGIIYGIIKKHKPLTILSVVALIMTIDTDLLCLYILLCGAKVLELVRFKPY